MKERPIPFTAPMVRALLDGRKTQTRRVIKLPHNNPLGEWEPMSIGGENGGKTRSGETIPEQGGIWHTRTGDSLMCPYGQPGDRLWVREAWRTYESLDDLKPSRIGIGAGVEYAAGGTNVIGADDTLHGMGKSRPPIFMPRWASRIDLEIKEIRVERLQDISEADAIAEGVEARLFPGPWWQGYMRLDDGELIHQQYVGESAPDWMIEPKLMKPTPHLDLSAVDMYRALWESINGPGSWDLNPFCWVIIFRRIK